jgi:hypothetical protein
VGSETLHRLAAAASDFPRTFIEDAADDVAADAEEALLADSGGDASLSHAPAELTVKVRVAGSSTVTGTVEAEGGGGQWKWLEEGTEPHLIGTWMHPGTLGKQTWSKGIGGAMKRLPRDADEQFSQMFNGA